MTQQFIHHHCQKARRILHSPPETPNRNSKSDRGTRRVLFDLGCGGVRFLSYGGALPRVSTVIEVKGSEAFGNLNPKPFCVCVYV